VPRFKPGPDGAPVLPKKLAVLPAGWRVEWVGDVAAFAMPQSWKEVGDEGQDPWARDFEGDGVAFAYRFGYSYGPFSCPPKTRCRERIVVVDGKEAQLMSYEDGDFPDGPRFFMGLYFPDAGGDATFSLWLYGNKQDDVKSAETIFKSVRFP